MSIWDEMGDKTVALIKQWLKDESQMTASQLEFIAVYMLDRPAIAYELSYRKATAEQRMEMRKRTDTLFAAGVAKARARKAARQELMLKIIQGIISTALMAVTKELE